MGRDELFRSKERFNKLTWSVLIIQCQGGGGRSGPRRGGGGAPPPGGVDERCCGGRRRGRHRCDNDRCRHRDEEGGGTAAPAIIDVCSWLSYSEMEYNFVTSELVVSTV